VEWGRKGRGKLHHISTKEEKERKISISFIEKQFRVYPSMAKEPGRNLVFKCTWRERERERTKKKV